MSQRSWVHTHPVYTLLEIVMKEAKHNPNKLKRMTKFCSLKQTRYRDGCECELNFSECSFYSCYKCSFSNGASQSRSFTEWKATTHCYHCYSATTTTITTKITRQSSRLQLPRTSLYLEPNHVYLGFCPYFLWYFPLFVSNLLISIHRFSRNFKAITTCQLGSLYLSFVCQYIILEFRQSLVLILAPVSQLSCLSQSVLM